MKRIVLLLAAIAGALSLPLFAEGGKVDWSKEERIADGIGLIHLSYDKPRLMKAQAMRVDLSNKAYFFAATGRDVRWGRQMPGGYTNLTIRTRRATVEEFLMNARAPVELGGRGLDMVVAFNTTPWSPCPEPIPTPYAQPHGYNVSDGVVISDANMDRVKGLFVVWKDGGVDILGTPIPESRRQDVWLAHAGFDIVLKDGKVLFGPCAGGVHPRTVVGLSRDHRWLYVLVVEGRHEGVSIGADYIDLAQIMLSLGASDALNMDGGGSTALVRWDDVAEKQVTCFAQDLPPRRNAMNVGICRRNPQPAIRRPPEGAALFEAAIDGSRDRCAGIYNSYEFSDVRDTPPPSGFKPFYISHYGRHGSRYQTRQVRLKAYETLQNAEKAGVLRMVGKKLLQRLGPLADAHQGMLGVLSKRGAEEHRRIAQRMHERFREVFAGGGKVRCQSSTHHRCLTSMANFSCSLKGCEPGLDFSFDTGDRYMDVIAHSGYGTKEERAELTKGIDAAMLHDFVKPERLMRLLFKDSPAVRDVVGDPAEFVSGLFALASAYPSLECEMDGFGIFDFFTRDELLALARYKNCKYYLRMGNSEEMGRRMVWAAQWLARDIVQRAETAVKEGVCADLRFGHDSGLFPLLGLLGVDGAGDRMPAAESWKRCQLWREMSMASNLQLILYSRQSGGGTQSEILVKVLHNEREVALRGMEPYAGPYYHWSDFVKRATTPITL